MLFSVSERPESFSFAGKNLKPAVALWLRHWMKTRQCWILFTAFLWHEAGKAFSFWNLQQCLGACLEPTKPKIPSATPVSELTWEYLHLQDQDLNSSLHPFQMCKFKHNILPSFSVFIYTVYLSKTYEMVLWFCSASSEMQFSVLRKMV